MYYFVTFCQKYLVKPKKSSIFAVCFADFLTETHCISLFYSKKQ